MPGSIYTLNSISFETVETASLKCLLFVSFSLIDLACNDT